MMPAGYHVGWYGRGPHENYADKKDSAVVDVHQAMVEEMFEHYTVPQENGNRSVVQWFSVRDGQG